mmetsp:Transcript_17/g.55  ORF Transcript_17/g.55 Transcript_17/m.55 type:complete len:490 (-) Transcript_17:394-1863(-)
MVLPRRLLLCYLGSHLAAALYFRGESSSTPYRQNLRNIGDASYVGTVYVGGQPVQTIMDTGSFDLLIFSKRCVMQCGKARLLYDDKASSSYRQGEAFTQHNFGSGSTMSLEAYDSLRIGPLVDPNQVFWEVYDADMPILYSGTFQGILGLGPPESSITLAKRDATEAKSELKDRVAAGTVTESQREAAKNYISLPSKLKETKSIVAMLKVQCFSICLGKASGSPGVVVWHDYPPEARPKDMFTTVQVAPESLYWSAELRGVDLGHSASQHQASSRIDLGCKDKSCLAVLDSGTSLLVMPRFAYEEVQTIFSDWRRNGGDCNDLSDLPNIEFSMGGTLFSLSPESYVGNLKVDGDAYKTLPNLTPFMPQLVEQSMRREQEAEILGEGDHTCTPLVMVMDMDLESEQRIWILGMPFFRQYYTTFSYQHGNASTHGRPVARSMSFARSDEHCRPTTKSNSTGEAVSAAGSLYRMQVDASKIHIPQLHKRHTN